MKMAVPMRSVGHTIPFPLPAIPTAALKFANTAATSIPANARCRASAVSFSGRGTSRKLPVLLFDIMDTIVRDPFYDDIPAFFGMSFKELIESKHPTSWVDFEKGLIDEVELARNFFKDGRNFDLEGLKACMVNGYSYIDGVEELLRDLRESNYEIHAFTNYPDWYQMIEDKLQVSKFLSWTFCSCKIGKRKPDLEFYKEVVRHLEVNPSDCIFIDDRLKNVEAASEVGIVGLQFKNVAQLRQDLFRLGIDVSAKDQLLVEDGHLNCQSS